DHGPENGPTASCTPQCRNARCGDGFVEAGVEDCDNGEKNGHTFDTPTCTHDCKATSCGDGVLQPGEECDDGNKDPGDGCSPSCTYEPVTCSDSGTIDLTVTFVSGPGTDHSKSVYGLDVSVGYPPSTSFPGDGLLPVGDPSDPSTRLKLLGAPGVNL